MGGFVSARHDATNKASSAEPRTNGRIDDAIADTLGSLTPVGCRQFPANAKNLLRVFPNTVVKFKLRTLSCLQITKTILSAFSAIP